MIGQEGIASNCSREGWIRLDIRKHFFSEGQLSKEVVQSPSLEMFKNCVDVALRDMGSGCGGGGLLVGLDLGGLFQP